MKIRCEFCGHCTWDEDDILEKVEAGIRESINEGKPVEKWFECYNCDAPVLKITFDAQACELEDE